jgi:hypothetical protein
MIGPLHDLASYMRRDLEAQAPLARTSRPIDAFRICVNAELFLLP